MGENGFYVNCTLMDETYIFGGLRGGPPGAFRDLGVLRLWFLWLEGCKDEGIFGAWGCPAWGFWSLGVPRRVFRDLGLPLLVFLGGIGDSHPGVFEA